MVKNVTDAFDELLKQRRWETTTDGAVAPAEPPPEADGAVEEPVEEAGPAEVAPPERLKEDERVIVKRLLEADETVGAAYALVQRFRTVLKGKDAAGLETWLTDAQASGIPSLAGVANGMLADHAAVAAAVTETWSNGTVEGHVHKVKLLKRQGYGRAAFALLRLRVLAA